MGVESFFVMLKYKDSNLCSASFTLNDGTAYKNPTLKLFYFNQSVAIL